jgi:hypothetical protein
MPIDPEALATDIVKAIRAAVDPLKARIAELEQKFPEHRGTWEPSRTYPKGTIVNHQDSSWMATAITDERPGEGATSWNLLSKRGARGRDGRDGRDFPGGRDARP